MNHASCKCAGIAVSVALGGFVAAAAGQPCGSGWQVAGAGPGTAPFHVAYDESRGRVVAFGRSLPAAPWLSAETWEWDGQTWTLRASTGPSPRARAAMAYDGTGILLFGGGVNASPPLGDTWRWDGVAGQWTQLSPANSPSPRFHAVLVRDPIRNRTVLYGGDRYHTPAVLTDTWEWDGSNWTEQNVAGPPAVYWSGLYPLGAYDALRQRITIYIGDNQSLWTRSSIGSSAWEPVTTNFGPTSPLGQLVFDQSRNTIVMMHGGPFTGSPPFTWEMGPGEPAWRLRSTTTPPVGGPLAYDAARQRVMLATSNQTWQWDGLSSGPSITALPSYLSAPVGASIQITVSALGEGLVYQWRQWEVPLSNGGSYSGVQTATLTIDPLEFPSWSSAHYLNVVVSNSCGAVVSPNVKVQVECGVDCDGTGGLTANDYICFLTAFNSGSSRANCDSSPGNSLTGNDFICFLNRYVSGDCTPF